MRFLDWEPPNLMPGPRFAPILLLAALAACSRPHSQADAGEGPPTRLNRAALETAIGAAVGDPDTCVIIADKASGRPLYQYGELFNCVRGLPACDRPGTLSARQAVQLAQAPQSREVSCNSVSDGSRMVGWAEGPVSPKSPDLVFSAVMEGQNAMPGHIMASRLFDAFTQAGL